MFSFIKNKILESFDRVKETLGFKKANFNDDDIKIIEKALLETNFGPNLTKKIISEIKNYFGEPISWEELVYKKLISTSNLNELGKISKINSAIMLIGINGSGKTTSAIKLARFCKNNNQFKTLVVAADTFRAAAQAQIILLCNQYNIDVFNDINIKDPSVMVYKGCEFSNNNNYDAIIFDTAGRIHSNDNLIKELVKIQKIANNKIIKKNLITYIVLDALQGNALVSQVENFKNQIKIDGIILTKLDAGVKPGIIYSIIDSYQLPVIYISEGQHETELIDFDIKKFTKTILGIND